jgi:DNA-binding NtrC family response regulator
MTARLALADDDAAFSEYLRTLLQTRGYEVDVYGSGAALLDGLRTGSPPQVILLDVLMPDLDGIETLRAIRHTHPRAQVIMLSGRQAPATIVEAVRLGAADYVLKPGDAEGVGEAALEAAIRNALERDSLTAEVARLGAQMTEDPDGMQLCWSSGEAMVPVMAMVDRVADSDVSVLMRGESGVGKEVIAREIHRRSPRRQKPFVKVNCAALPADLLESELFGHEKGAFTGAGNTRVGRFEFAQGGTILLDEIGEMPAALQAKLLHVLQDREFTRLGSNRPVEVDVRVLAATNRRLEDMMQAGTFREDLYYRLQVIEIHVPSLRTRREEIPALVEFFLVKYGRLYRRPPLRPTRELVDALLDYPWPGNIRELENMMKRFVVLQDEHLILGEIVRLRQQHGTLAAEPSPPARTVSGSTDLPGEAQRDVPVAPPLSDLAGLSALALNGAPLPAPESPGESNLDEGGAVTESDGGVDLPALARAAAMRTERRAILAALTRFRWNRRKAAVHLNVSYKTLLNKMKECGITETTPDARPPQAEAGGSPLRQD